MTDPTHLTQPCARVNGAFMRENVGRKVRLVCKQEGISGRTMTVLAADNARLTVNLAEGASYDTEYIEFEGVVDSDTVLTEHSHTNFGNNFGARLLIITPSLPVKHRAAGLKHRRTAWHVDRCVSRSLPCERRIGLRRMRIRKGGARERVSWRNRTTYAANGTCKVHVTTLAALITAPRLASPVDVPSHGEAAEARTPAAVRLPATPPSIV
jgi:hypothetical protein